MKEKFTIAYKTDYHCNETGSHISNQHITITAKSFEHAKQMIIDYHEEQFEERCYDFKLIKEEEIVTLNHQELTSLMFDTLIKIKMLLEDKSSFEHSIYELNRVVEQRIKDSSLNEKEKQARQIEYNSLLNDVRIHDKLLKLVK